MKEPELHAGTPEKARSLHEVDGQRVARSLVESALEILGQSHIKDNQWRLGALGSGDIDIVRRYLSSALEKLPIDQAER